MSGGDRASPSACIIKIFNAKAVARMDGWVTFASAVLDGPVLKNRKNIAKNRQIQAAGKGTYNIATTNGNESKIPAPETRK